MTFFRLLPRIASRMALSLALPWLFISQGCTPSGLGLDLNEVLTKHNWEVAELNVTYDYRFEERYEVPSSGNWRKIAQSGEIIIDYDADRRDWQITERFNRQEEGTSGPLPSTQYQWDTTLTSMYGEWRFSAAEAGLGRLIQQYYDQSQSCRFYRGWESLWATDVKVESPEEADILSFDLLSMLPHAMGGDIVLYPERFGGGGDPHLFTVVAKVRLDGEEVILQENPEQVPQARSAAFSMPDYGDVTIEEDYSQVYFRIRLRPVTEAGCESAPSGSCDLQQVPCENGTLRRGELGECRCECQEGWQGEACDQTLGFTWVNTVVGQGVAGFVDGGSQVALLDRPQGLVADGQDQVYFADANNAAIRMVDLNTRVVSTVAGDGTPGYQDGPGSQARFDQPQGLTLDPISGDLYVADFGNRIIRKISSDGTVSTIAGVPGSSGIQNGPALTAEFMSPTALLWDQRVLRGHPVLLIADGSQLRLLDLLTMEVSTYAGSFGGILSYQNGPAAQAQFGEIAGIVLQPNGTIYLADRSNHAIRAISSTGNRMVSTFMGADPGGRIVNLPANQPLNYPVGLAFNGIDRLYLSDSHHHIVRAFTILGGTPVETQTLGDADSQSSGNEDGIPALARFDDPSWMCTLPNGDLLVSDRGNHSIRRLIQ